MNQSSTPRDGSDVVVRPFRAEDPVILRQACAASNLEKPITLFERYLSEHDARTRYAVVAERGGLVAGYVTLAWTSAYLPFADRGVPEVSDLNVLPHHRRAGIATCLLDHLEHVAGQRSPVIGLGVGLYADYGAAHRLYVGRGYVPDGRGLMYANRAVRAGESVVLDDSATLMFTKRLATTS